MKSFEQIGIHIIKCQSKHTNESLKSLQYKANEILFPLPKRVASKKALERLLAKLITIGKDISNLDCPTNVTDKRSEILEQIRSMCINVKQQLKQSEDITQEEADRVFRYQTSQYLKKKDTTLDESNILNLLQQNKELSEDYPNPTIKFLDMQKELIQELCNRYSI